MLPSPPTRPNRLRGLSYLRNIGRTTSYPPSTPTSPTNAPVQSLPTTPGDTNELPGDTNELPVAASSNSEDIGSTSGWLPTVGGQSGVSRIGTKPQPSAAPSLPSAVVLSGNDSGSVAPDSTSSSMPRISSPRGQRPAAGNVLGGSGLAGDVFGGDVSTLNGNRSTQHARGPVTLQLPSIKFSPHQDPRALRPSLVFSPMLRTLPTGVEVIKVGRYSEKESLPIQASNMPSAAAVGFKSKVVSRRHCEFWFAGGRWFIKDVRSSSGTFLNHIRLSSPNAESNPYPINDGDIVQLGIDFKGGEEMIFRCVKIRVELNKSWTSGPTSFNVQSHKRLRELNNLGKKLPSGSASSQDCSICLGPIAPCQSLFVAPCSHTWHYKCIRILINGPQWPHFTCPNCRDVANLEAELEDPTNGGWEDIGVGDDALVQPEIVVPAERPVEQHGANLSNEVQVSTQGSEQGPPRPTETRAESSDESDSSRRPRSEASSEVNMATGEMDDLNIEEQHSSDSPDVQIPHVSNATVNPVDIVSRKPLPGSSSHLGQAVGPSRRINRTPSPNASSSLDVVPGIEGPMTPRNDVGPFVFDGSAGQDSEMRMAAIASMHLNDAEEIHTTQQPTLP